MSEETVVAETTIYVNSESGVDREDVRGDSPETAFRTIQYAVNHAAGSGQPNTRTVFVLEGKRAHFISTGGASLHETLRRALTPMGLDARGAATDGAVVLRSLSTVTGSGGVGGPSDLDLRSMMKALSHQPGIKKNSRREMSQAPFRRGGRG